MQFFMLNKNKFKMNYFRIPIIIIIGKISHYGIQKWSQNFRNFLFFWVQNKIF
jgi:hypothetical protein